jgi:ribosomal protein L9
MVWRNISQLLNFFPILGEDEDGQMVEIDAQAVLSIPRRLKSMEVVRRGFMSNYLFANIGNAFAAPVAVTEIVENLTPLKKDDFDAQRNTMMNLQDATDKHGAIDIPEQIVIGKSADLFGPKIYETITDAIDPTLDDLDMDSNPNNIKANIKAVAEALKTSIQDDIIKPAANEYGISKSKQDC